MMKILPLLLVIAFFTVCSFTYKTILFQSQFKIEKGITVPDDTFFVFSSYEVITKITDGEMHEKVKEIVNTPTSIVYWTGINQYTVTRHEIKVQPKTSQFYALYR